MGGSTRLSTIFPNVSNTQSLAPVAALPALATTSVHSDRCCTVAVTLRRSLDTVLGTARHADRSSS